MTMVNLTINNKKVEVPKGTSILDAAKKLNIEIPTLCNMHMVDGQTRNCKGTCRICVVEVEGKGSLIPSCSVDVSEGMNVKTHTPRVLKARRTILDLLLSDHPQDCLKCEKNLKCELQKLAMDFGIERIKYEGEISRYPIDSSSPSIIRDMDKCILCRRCVTACNDVQKVHALTNVERGFNSVISTFFNKPLSETECTYCGQCLAVCPTGALREVRDYDKVWDVLGDKNKFVLVQTAPAVRVALGEEFGFESGAITTGKMVGALKTLGFNGVYDTNFGADLTIMEEAYEFVDRFTKGENLPLITSCCPAWVKFIEDKYPEYLNLPSSCKSPQQMFGAIAKTYLAKKLNIEPKDIVVVSVMPCVAKKYEAKREEMGRDGIRDVDVVITTRELAKMIKETGINLKDIEDANFDNPLGESTGAGVIFGTTGGVMEAALRTAYEVVTGKTLENVNFEQVRGLQGIKEANVNLNGKEVRIAVASSLGNAKKIMEDIKNGKCKYDFIEIMACPGGCIDGGGQPFIKSNREILKKRMEGLYTEDTNNKLRKSHDNPVIKEVYNEFLENPNSHKAHELLHTHYGKK
ncbi:NADH-dependent [FeFe] hydrogenase, group A6 [Clostridium frigidicarnis]|uniref:NAD(P)-dependent iron-only hydrogenase catalytic subunit n=1 Tax=Clostridium frigidicarnis TaxID=84698 RepID=A0A1I0W5S0_9CLOT|nr:NADH-dependent [FeFe] hydrogenase, group A6 [Clostridium frigidicarnis]SFA83640.1 NAD(P)-dependent iron-only hydrogenase catalytic subunit [Clostridium frigidicarnis]